MNCAVLQTGWRLADLAMAFAGICAAFVCVFLAVVLLLNAWADFRKPRGGTR